MSDEVTPPDTTQITVDLTQDAPGLREWLARLGVEYQPYITYTFEGRQLQQMWTFAQALLIAEVQRQMGFNIKLGNLNKQMIEYTKSMEGINTSLREELEVAKARIDFLGKELDSYTLSGRSL